MLILLVDQKVKLKQKPKNIYDTERFVALYADETVPYREIVKILNIANDNRLKMVLAAKPVHNP
jgi:biopolymer transport protein ExbD